MRLFLISALALLISACATTQRLDAANDVHALLIAIRDNDRRAFDAYVDRPALKREIEVRLVAEARGRDPRLAGVASLLAPSLAAVAGEALVQPEVFRAVAAHHGYDRDTRIPNPLIISQALRHQGDGQVCTITRKDGPCLLVFTRAPDGRWRLSGFEGDTSMLRLRL